VESVKGQMNHETEVFSKIAEARAKIGNGSVTSKENQEAQGELSSAISRLISLTENYPELKSNQNVEQLMTELAGSENRIFVARKDYNQVATKPPTFVIFVNEEELMHFSYLRFLENQIRKAFVFEGTPIHLIARKRK